MQLRLAREEDLERINELRRQVNDVHVAGKPEIFKAGFAQELQDRIYEIWNDAEQDVAVAELDGVICGFAVLRHVRKPENPFMLERDYLEIDEFGVDEPFRRRGVATALIGFVRAYASERDIRRVELNMWEFNEGALVFYEAVGFATYRRYMEMTL